MSRKSLITKSMKSKIKQIMKAKKIRYRDIEAKGFSSLTIATAIKDISRCKMETLERLAKALDCNVSDLYEEVPLKTAKKISQT